MLSGMGFWKGAHVPCAAGTRWQAATYLGGAWSNGGAPPHRCDMSTDSD
jgi:hypothetical protein